MQCWLTTRWIGPGIQQLKQEEVKMQVTRLAIEGAIPGRSASGTPASLRLAARPPRRRAHFKQSAHKRSHHVQVLSTQIHCSSIDTGELFTTYYISITISYISTYIRKSECH